MQIFKSICQLEKKLCHFEIFVIFSNWKYSKPSILQDAGSDINYFIDIWSTILPNFIEIRSQETKIWQKHHARGSESQMWPPSKNQMTEHKINSKWLNNHTNWITNQPHRPGSLVAKWKNRVFFSKFTDDEEGECFAPLLPFGKVLQVEGWDRPIFWCSFTWWSRFFHGETGNLDTFHFLVPFCGL